MKEREEEREKKREREKEREIERERERDSLSSSFSLFPFFSIFIKLFFSGFQFLKFSKDTKKSRKNVNSFDIKIYIILMNQCH